jgi:hypothetical protein
VLEAAAASQWCPDGAVEVLTDDYRLIRYPDWALDPAFPAAQVTRSRSERAAAEVIGEVAERVRQWGKPGVAWWVSSATRPPDTEAALRAAGGKQIDAVQILARELDGDDDAGPAGSGDVSVALVVGERAFRAASMVAVRGWGRKEPTGPRSPASTPKQSRTWRPGPVSACWPRCEASPPRSAGARCAGRWPTYGARSPCGSTAGAVPTGPCWPNGCGWPAPTAPRWPW